MPASPVSQASPSLPGGSNGSSSGQDRQDAPAEVTSTSYGAAGMRGVNMTHTAGAGTVDPSAYSSIRNNVTLSSLATPDPGNHAPEAYHSTPHPPDSRALVFIIPWF